MNLERTHPNLRFDTEMENNHLFNIKEEPFEIKNELVDKNELLKTNQQIHENIIKS